MNRTPIPAVGVVCLKGDDVLLIKRGKAPLQDRWTLPGGHLEWGETTRAAALRELKEETGVEAELIGLVDVVDAVMNTDSGEAHFVLIDYAARWRAGEPRAGDDAADARFFTPEEVEVLGLWPETLRVIEAARAVDDTVNEKWTPLRRE